MPRPGTDTRWLDPSTLDGLRGLAAVYVVLDHSRWLLWAGATTAKADSTGLARLAANGAGVFRFGVAAVMLFFLISGFCIHYRQAKRISELRLTGRARPASFAQLFDVRSYGLRRLRRLYPPFVFAILLTAALDRIGALINPEFYAGASAYDSINVYLLGGGDHFAVQTLLGNLLMQSSLSVPTFGTDAALWSLGVEAWFYVLYPGVVWLSLRTGPRGMLLTVACLSAATYLASTAGLGTAPGWVLHVVSYWVIWVTGAAVAEAFASYSRPRWLPWLLPVAIVCLGLAAFENVRHWAHLDAIGESYLWAAGLGIVFAAALLCSSGKLVDHIERSARHLQFLGTISYSLYLVHCPWLAFLSACWLAAHARLPVGAELAVPGALSALVVATLAWFIAERRFMTPVSARESAARPVSPRTWAGV